MSVINAAQRRLLTDNPPRFPAVRPGAHGPGYMLPPLRGWTVLGFEGLGGGVLRRSISV